jgi:hypothetical protein
MILLRLVDSRTGQPVPHLHPLLVQALPDAEDRLVQSAVIDEAVEFGGQWVDCRRTGEEGLVTRFVALKDSDAVPTSIDIRLDVPGFYGTKVHSTLLLPSQAVDEGQAQVVRMHALTERETGTVRVRVHRAYGADIVAQAPTLNVQGEGVRIMTIQPEADATEDDLYEFRNVPAGAIRAYVDDGIAQSRVTPVSVAASSVTVLDASLDSVCGIALRVRASGADGGRLLEADVLGRFLENAVKVSVPDTQGVHAAAFLGVDTWNPPRVPAALPASLPERDTFRWFYRFPPGRFRLQVSKLGYETQSVDVDIVPGNVTNVDVWLPQLR